MSRQFTDVERYGLTPDRTAKMAQAIQKTIWNRYTDADYQAIGENKRQAEAGGGDYNLMVLAGQLTELRRFVLFIAELPRVADLPMREAQAAIDDALEKLWLFNQMSTELENAEPPNVPLLHYPELFLVARLRELGVSWARIAEQVDVHTTALYRRYKDVLDTIEKGNAQ